MKSPASAYKILRTGVLSLLASAALALPAMAEDKSSSLAASTFEVVAELDINPGNVAVSKEGRVFTTIHPIRKGSLQLAEVLSDSTLVPFPNEAMQSTSDSATLDKFDAPLGLLFDNKNRLWVVDVGLNLGQARIFAYDIDTTEQLYRFDVPKELAPSTSFVQDIVVDEGNDILYIADAINPALIVIDMRSATFRKIVHTPSMAPEDIDMVINGQVQYFFGDPIRIAIDGITISEDRETIFYGAMSSTNWYQVSAKKIREGASDEEVFETIKRVGAKPLSDGSATDNDGNHYFTNVQEGSISVLSKDGELSTLMKHEFLDWPDSVRIHNDWLYVTSNQIYKSAAFQGEEQAITPYRILRFKYQQ
ncbi:MAG: L-dopachrome tautomerase-related protein [Pseudomonadota bacterium]